MYPPRRRRTRSPGSPLIKLYDPRDRAIQQQQPARPPKLPGIDLFIYSDGQVAAGVGFRIEQGAVRPVTEIRPFSVEEDYSGVADAVVRISADHGAIDSVITPWSASRTGYNQGAVQQALPNNQPYRSAVKSPKFDECCENRMAALSSGALIERDYAGTPQLLEQLAKCSEDKQPSALLWAYLLGVYDLTLYGAWSKPGIEKLFFTASPPLF